MRSKTLVLFLALVVTSTLMAVALLGSENASAQPDMLVYKSPTCGCCSGWIEYMASDGYTADTVHPVDLNGIKDTYGVPKDLRSCHTTIMDGYVIEGHVPLPAIERLFEQRPDVDGIAVPGMPSGSPGMSGERTGPIEVYSFDDGEVELFMVL